MKLYNPQHLNLISNGHGEFPDVYELTKEGRAMIAEHMGDIVETAYKNVQTNIIIDDETNYYYEGVNAMKQEIFKLLKLL